MVKLTQFLGCLFRKKWLKSWLKHGGKEENVNPNFSVILNCRLCKSPKIRQVLPFGLSPLANSYPTSKNQREEFYPLTVMMCEECGHVQLRETIKPEILFSDYLYASSDSPSLQAHFKSYASTVATKVKLPELGNVLEIGCNDGVLLKEFEALGYTQLVGVEPAKNIAELAKTRTGAKIFNHFFDIQTAMHIGEKCGKFSLICANNVFAHVAQLDSMMLGINELLDANGVFVFENAYLLDTIKNLYFDQIYHEHLQYYGIKPLVKYFAQYDMEIFDVEHVNTQGGSFRAYVKKKCNNQIHIQPSVGNAINDEEDFCLYDKNTYIQFNNQLERLRADLRKVVDDALDHNQTISCYGCPAKFTLFSKFFGLSDKMIKYVVDDSPLKQGRFSPGVKIPIVSREHFLQHPTDYCILTVWNMAEAIMAKNKQYEGYFVVPMPQVKIVKHWFAK